MKILSSGDVPRFDRSLRWTFVFNILAGVTRFLSDFSEMKGFVERLVFKEISTTRKREQG